ncbi:glycosyl transferase, partial [Thermococci archaeon]
MVKPTVSIVIPTHNRSKLLKRAINSVLRQT